MSGGRKGTVRADNDFSGIWTFAEVAERKLAGTWPALYSTTALARSPSGLYLFEETSGTQLTDTSGNANHGTYQNGALPSSPGLTFETTLSLEAVSGQFAQVPGVVAEATSGFSIAVWLQFSHSLNRPFLERNANTGYSMQTRGAADAGKIGLTTGGGTPQEWLRSSIAINDDLPHCAVYVFGGTPTSSYLYIDGVDRSTRPQTSGTPNYGSTTAWDVGQRPGGNAFAGRLDGLAFFPSLLTQADALALYQARKF